ncbi:hypothetical protein HDU98_010777, partial [Podochytrium sp. JEL0797]
MSDSNHITIAEPVVSPASAPLPVEVEAPKKEKKGEKALTVTEHMMSIPDVAAKYSVSINEAKP